MKRVYSARHPAEAHMIRDLLEAQGIPAVVRGETIFGLRGEVPLTTETAPSVWVPDEHFDEAKGFVADYDQSTPAPADPAPTWTCSTCGESVEEQFGVCWNCSTPRPTA